MRLVLNIFTTLFFIGSTLITNAQELPSPSPLGKVEQRVGLTDVSIEYSRPGVKDRKIFGDLLTYGELWRTGANASTKITFSTDVTISGSSVAAGTYAIFTIPGENEWTFILNKNVNQSGTNDYSKDLDAVRINVKPETTPMRETMTFVIDEVRDNGAVIELNWETTSIKIPFEVDYKSMATANIEAKLKELDENFSAYNRIARYYVDNNMNLEKALELAKKSVEMRKEFWNVYTLSLAQAANSMYKEAVQSAELSKELAVKAKYQVYVDRNDTNIAKWKKMK